MDLAQACGDGDTVACQVSMSGHVMGGAYADRDPRDTAFYFRDKIWVMFGMLGNPSLSPQWTRWETNEDLERGREMATELCRYVDYGGLA